MPTCGVIIINSCNYASKKNIHSNVAILACSVPPTLSSIYNVSVTLQGEGALRALPQCSLRTLQHQTVLVLHQLWLCHRHLWPLSGNLHCVPMDPTSATSCLAP